MNKTFLHLRWLTLAVAVCLSVLGAGAQSFKPGTLYHLVSALKGHVVDADGQGHLALSALNEKDAGQHFVMSELSGSWRIINPFNNQAVRYNGNGVEAGENNGSDEAQLWRVVADGSHYNLVPTNNPGKAAAVQGSKLVLIDKAKAAGNKAAQFSLAEAARAGFDAELTYRIRSVQHPDMVLGNGDSGENNAHIVGETADKDNRGQYWNIKMLDLDRRVVANAFYTQNFDDGGGNASIDYLLQWPAQDGVWNNAQFCFEPVKGQTGTYIIRSVGKTKADKMYSLVNGQLKSVAYNAKDKAAWFTFEQVEKPQNKSPYWEDETRFAENKETGVATYLPYNNEHEMLADKAYYNTPWTKPQTGRYMSLNGTWKFHFVPEPSQRPLDFWQENYDVSQWNTIPVPSNWEMLGYDKPTEEWTVYSVGGGALSEGKGKEDQCFRPEQVYNLHTTKDILGWCEDNGRGYWEYVALCEDKDIWDYLRQVWQVMQRAVHRGIDHEGALPGPLHLARKAPTYYTKSLAYKPSLQSRGRVFAYALAVSEENASGGTVATAPTCGASGVVPGVLVHLAEFHNFSETRILHALATAGIFGNIVKYNASISGAEVGCQGEVGVACAMASAATCQLFGGTPSQIEYAAEMGLEHHLGMTCDPVCGLVQIPCIERNAFAACRALDAQLYASLSDGKHRVSFDKVVDVMKRTGHDIPSLYKETSEGGLAKEF